MSEKSVVTITLLIIISQICCCTGSGVRPADQRQSADLSSAHEEVHTTPDGPATRLQSSQLVRLLQAFRILDANLLTQVWLQVRHKVLFRFIWNAIHATNLHAAGSCLRQLVCPAMIRQSFQRLPTCSYQLPGRCLSHVPAATIGRPRRVL